MIIIRRAEVEEEEGKKFFLLNLMAPRARTAIKENNDFTVMPISFISSFFNWNSIKNRFQLIPSEDIPTQTTLRFFYSFLIFGESQSFEISSQFRRESHFFYLTMHISSNTMPSPLENNQHIKAWFFNKINFHEMTTTAMSICRASFLCFVCALKSFDFYFDDCKF